MNINGYIILVQGQISETMKEWFEDVMVESPDNQSTSLYLPLGDQAFLFGILLRIRDLGLRLISVNPYED
jgi:hypothetical protein